MTDHAWVQTARLANRSAADDECPEQAEVVQLFGELRVPLLRYLHGLGLPACDGEDVVQDAFLALFRHLRAGKPRDHLPAWTFRVARNLALKRIQQAAQQPRWDEDCTNAPDRAANPEERVVHSQRERTTLAVIGALTPLDRQCLQLRADGLRYREIAEVLEMSLGAVAASVGRALSRIARATQQEK